MISFAREWNCVSRAPWESSPLPAKEAEGIVLIGAGVGITPLMSVVRYLTDRKMAGPDSSGLLRQK